MQELPVRENNLISLWNWFYNKEYLERIDLKREWDFVQKNSTKKIFDIIRESCSLDKYEFEEISTNLELIIEKINEFSAEDRSIFTVNFLPHIIQCFQNRNFHYVNFLLDRIKVVNGYEHTRTIPEKIIIELTNSCNLNCIMCGIGKNGYNSNRTMKLADFKEIMNVLDDTKKIIRINGLGESLIIPNIMEYLDLLKQYNHNYEIITNFSIANREVIKRLVELEFDLYISCDSHNLNKLSEIRHGISIKDFSENISLLKKNKKRDPMKNHIIFTAMKNNYEDLLGVIEFAYLNNISSVIVNMVKSTNNEWMREKTNEIKFIFEKASIKAKESNIKIKLPNQITGEIINSKYNTTNTYFCNTYMNEIFIRYNGDVCPCNMMNPYIFGNIKRDGLEIILNNFHSRLFSEIMNSINRYYYCIYCYFMH